MQNTLPVRPPQTFISYSRVNQQMAIRLACELKSAGFCVWMDQFDIPTGARWDDEIEKALRDCDIFLFIITPASIASENAKDELGYAIDHGKRILPVFLEPCEVPLRLRRMQYVDFTRLSFDEGILRARELLTKLVREIEGSGSETSGTVSPGSTLKSPTASVHEPKTVPTGRETISYGPRGGFRPPGRWTATRIIAGIGILAIGLLLLGVFLFRAPLLAPSLSTSPVATAVPTRTIASMDTPEPTRTRLTPTAAILRSFTEEFDSDDQWNTGWSARLRHGDARKEANFKYAVSDGDLIVDLTHQYIWGYFLYDPASVYSHVEIEVVVDGLRSIDTFGLVCQFSDAGWYEFDVNGGGEYFVRFVDSMKADHDEARFLIDSGYVRGFNFVTGIIKQNNVRVKCDSNKLSFYVNDRELMKDFPTRFILEQGQVGLTVRSYTNYPVKVVVKSIKVREP